MAEEEVSSHLQVKQIEGFSATVQQNDNDLNRCSYKFAEEPTREKFLDLLKVQLMRIQEAHLRKFPVTTDEDITRESQRIADWIEDFGDDVIDNRRDTSAYDELRIYMTRDSRTFNFDIYDNSRQMRPQYIFKV